MRGADPVLAASADVQMVDTVGGPETRSWSAEWYLWRLKAIADVNPMLLVDLMDGAISFEDANRAAIAADLIIGP